MDYIIFDINKNFNLKNNENLRIKNLEIDFFKEKINIFVLSSIPLSSYFITSNSIFIKHEVENILKKITSFNFDLVVIFNYLNNKKNYYIQLNLTQKKDIKNFYLYLKTRKL